MKVAFWSNVRGKSCVTSNLACMSVLSALRCPGRRTIVFENHQNMINLGNTYFRPYSDNTVNESTNYSVITGLEKIFQFVEQGELLSEDRFLRYTNDFLGKQLLYLSSESIHNADILEYRMSKECCRTLDYLEKYSDMVFVDTSAAPLVSSRKILQEADIVVVNLVQNPSMLSHFFRNFSDIRKKAFYIVGNYEEERTLNKHAIMQKYGIMEDRIGTVFHNSDFADALSNGQLIPFLSKNYCCNPDDVNYPFINAAKQAEQLFYNHIWNRGDGI